MVVGQLCLKWPPPPGERHAEAKVSGDKVALFLGIAVAAGALELPWVTVGIYDALVGLAQIGLLARGELGRVG